MDTQIIQVYCLCDDLLKAMQHREDRQCQLRDAEVMTVAIVAALHHGGHFVKAGEMLSEHGYLAMMLGRSRFNRPTPLPLRALNSKSCSLSSPSAFLACHCDGSNLSYL